MYPDVPIQLQNLLNQHWLAINLGLIFLWLLLIYFTAKKPVLGAGLIIILLPTYLFRAKIFGLPTTYLEICLGIFFVTFFLKKIITHQQNHTPQSPPPCSMFHVACYMFLLAATISVFVSPNTLPALGLWKAYFLEPILFFLILLKIIKTSKDKEIIFWSLGISTLSISLYAIFQKFTGFGIAEPMWVAAATRRVTAFFTSPNAVGLYLGPILVLFLGQIMQNAKCKMQNYGVAARLFLISIMALAIWFTKSAGTIIGVLAGAAFLGFFGFRRKWALALIGILILAVVLIPAARDKIMPVVTFSDPAGQNRLSLWQGSWQYLTASPKNFIFGAGLFGFPALHEQFRDPLKTEPLIYPHNIFLNFWLDTGLLGLIAITWIIVLSFKTGFKTWNMEHGTWNMAVMAALIVILIHGLVDVPYFKNDLAILFWIIVVLGFSNLPTHSH